MGLGLGLVLGLGLGEAVTEVAKILYSQVRVGVGVRAGVRV